MNSLRNSRCSHRLGSPIRTSPDHRLLASPRGFSQLATSFIAYLCQGIHTHALSSLTIKFTLNTEQICATTLPHYLLLLLCGNGATFVVSCPSIFNCQRSDFFVTYRSSLRMIARLPKTSKISFRTGRTLTFRLLLDWPLTYGRGSERLLCNGGPG